MSTGSSTWHLLYSFPPNDFDAIERGYDDFAERWGRAASSCAVHLLIWRSGDLVIDLVI